MRNLKTQYSLSLVIYGLLVIIFFYNMSTPTCRYCDAEKTFPSVVRGYNIINIPSCFIMSVHIKLVPNRLCKGLILSHYRYQYKSIKQFSNLCNVLISIISWLYGNLVLFISFDKTRQDWRVKHRVSLIPLLSTQTNKVSKTVSASCWAQYKFCYKSDDLDIFNQII